MSQIKKISIWKNPTGLKRVGGPRWDGHVWFTDGTSKRIMQLDKDKVLALLNEIEF